MSGGERRKDRRKSSRVLDFFVVMLCLLCFTVSLYFFQDDLFRTFRLSAKPAGTVTVKYNDVQRRLSDRVVWDRLSSETPVYDGDLIRVAKMSGVTIDIERSSIELGENTLVRVQSGVGSTVINLYSGGVTVAPDSIGGGNIVLAMGDRRIEAAPGAVFTASLDDNGMTLQVSEGTARVIQDKNVTDVTAGDVIVQDNAGNEVNEPLAAMIQPKPNARYLKTSSSPMEVSFLWNRINLVPSALLKLEIAEDKNFSRISRTINNLNSRSTVSLDGGVWNWRLSYRDKILSSGRLTITQTSAPDLLSPRQEQQISYRTTIPEVQFRWTEVEDALGYSLQVSQSSQFLNPKINTQVEGTSFVSYDLENAEWYWRVMPVYSPGYEGNAVSSAVSSFNISRNGTLEPVSLNMPASDSMIYIGEDRTGFSFSWTTAPEASYYTILISDNARLRDPIISRTLKGNYFTYKNNEGILVPERYYWSVLYTDEDGNVSSLPKPLSFMTYESEIIQKLVFPPDRYTVEEGQLKNISFSWDSNLLVDKRFQLSASPDFSRIEIDSPVSGNVMRGISVPPGDWYWRVSAKQSEKSIAYTTQPRRFSISSQPSASEPQAAPQIASPAAAPARPVYPAPASQRRLTLISPADGAVIPGLAAMRGPTVFRWSTTENIGKSRFVLSRRSNPAQGRAEVEIMNPGRSVDVGKIGEGVWYWTVEAQTPQGQLVVAQTPRQLIVQPVSLLPAPVNLQPPRGYSVGEQEIRQSREILFNWSAVRDANAYILTINMETPSGPRQVFQADVESGTSYTFKNFGLLDYEAVYVWQVEAVHFNSQGILEQRGHPGESSFVTNIPRPGRVTTEDTGVLYGF